MSFPKANRILVACIPLLMAACAPTGFQECSPDFRGVVLDSVTHRPVAGARVRFVEKSSSYPAESRQAFFVSASSDSKGYFHLHPKHDVRWRTVKFGPSWSDPEVTFFDDLYIEHPSYETLVLGRLGDVCRVHHAGNSGLTGIWRFSHDFPLPQKFVFTERSLNDLAQQAKQCQTNASWYLHDRYVGIILLSPKH